MRKISSSPRAEASRRAGGAFSRASRADPAWARTSRALAFRAESLPFRSAASNRSSCSSRGVSTRSTQSESSFRAAASRVGDCSGRRSAGRSQPLHRRPGAGLPGESRPMQPFGGDRRWPAGPWSRRRLPVWQSEFRARWNDHDRGQRQRPLPDLPLKHSVFHQHGTTGLAVGELISSVARPLLRLRSFPIGREVLGALTLLGHAVQEA